MKSENGHDQRADTVVFLHIPKTAGTTLNPVLKQQYRFSFMWGGTWVAEAMQKLITLPPAQRRLIQVVKGHMGFGIHTLLPQPCRYFTILREPVDRVLSWYYHLLREGGPITVYEVQKMSLMEFVCSPLARDIHNLQTRLLAGVDPIDYVPGVNVDPRTGEIVTFEDGHWRRSDATLSSAKWGECTRETLETAKSNLKEYFPVVGLSERFEDTLLLLRRVFGWRRTSYLRLNVTPNRPYREVVPLDITRAIEERNQLDIELYNFGKELFETQLSSYRGPAFARDRAVLAVSNAFTQSVDSSKRTVARTWLYRKMKPVRIWIRGLLRRGSRTGEGVTTG